MKVIITPKKLSGSVFAPPSKSYAHRALIAAALCFSQTVRINNVALSEDIEATMDCLRAMGAHFTLKKTAGGRYGIAVRGIERIPEEAEFDCRESGSTLRLLIPICAALGIKAVFTGRGKLPLRPVDTYIRELSKKGITFIKPEKSYLPLKMSGRLHGGEFTVEGNISSQFVSGLMYALPLCSDDSSISVTGNFESEGYVQMTAGTLRKFGISVVRERNNDFYIHGGQGYFNIKKSCMVENDWSQAAFFYAANFLGSVLDIKVSRKSVQPDAVIVDILKDFESGSVSDLSVSQCPDILPILAVAASFSPQTVHFINAERLMIKESNRLKTTADIINALGGSAAYDENSLTVNPVNHFTGGIIDGAGDHRIVMSAAIAAIKSESQVTILGAESVAKSYPDFFEVYAGLGGEIEIIK